MNDTDMLFDPDKVLAVKRRLLEPEALSEPGELERIIKPKLRYVGPGPWLEILKEAEEKKTCRQ